MLLPSIFGENLLDDWMMDFPRMDFPRQDFADVDRKLYGKHAANVMKTDVHEHDEGYEVDIDLPGFKKDEISLDLENGYLSVSAAKGIEKDDKDKKGRLIRQERYSGAMQRSFFVGDAITEEDIKAKFEDGVLRLSIPKKDAPKIPEKKTIAIEG
jgi:HSP20 family molecular chaperone IbpA